MFSRNFWLNFGRNFGRSFGQSGQNFGFGRNYVWPFRSFTNCAYLMFDSTNVPTYLFASVCSCKEKPNTKIKAPRVHFGKLQRGFLISSNSIWELKFQNQLNLYNALVSLSLRHTSAMYLYFEWKKLDIHFLCHPQGVRLFCDL